MGVNYWVDIDEYIKGTDFPVESGAL